MSNLFLLLIILGIILIFFDSFKYLFKDMSISLNSLIQGQRQSGSLQKHLLRLLSVFVDEGNEKKALATFYTVSILIFFGFCFLLWPFFRVQAILLSALISLLPYGFLRVRLLMVQRSGSFEGEMLIKELRNQYKLNYSNMLVAIDRTVESLTKEQPLSKRILFRLSLRLKTYKTEDELKEILADFTFAYGTEWVKMLSHNIYNAVYEHTNVAAGLDDMLDVCRQINFRLEKTKQNAAQSSVMIKGLAPIFVVGFYWMASIMMDISDIIRIQFTTSTGILMFIIIILSMLVNIAASILVNKPKYDI